MCGLLGAVCALASLTAPSLVIIVLGCKLLGAAHADPRVAGAIRGLSVGAAALLLHTAWQLGQGSLTSAEPLERRLWLLVAATAAVCALATALHPAWIIVGGGLLGVLLARRVGERTR